MPAAGIKQHLGNPGWKICGSEKLRQVINERHNAQFPYPQQFFSLVSSRWTFKPGGRCFGNPCARRCVQIMRLPGNRPTRAMTDHHALDAA